MAKYIIMDENGTPTGAPHQCTTPMLPNRNTYQDTWVSLGSFLAEDAGLCAAMCATSAISLLDGGPSILQVGQYSTDGGPKPASNVEAGMAVVSDALGDKRACEAWVFCDDHVSYLVDGSDMAPLRRKDPSDIAFKPRATIVPPNPVMDPDENPYAAPDPNEPCLGEVVVRNGRVYAQPYWYDNPNAPNLCVQKRKDARCFNPDRSRSVSAGECTLYSNVTLPSTSASSTFAGPPPVDERGWGSLLQHAGDASSLDDFDWWRKDGGNWTKHNTLFADDPDTGLPPLAEDGDGDVPWGRSNDPWLVGETNGVKPWPGTFMSGVCAWTLGVD